MEMKELMQTSNALIYVSKCWPILGPLARTFQPDIHQTINVIHRPCQPYAIPQAEDITRHGVTSDALQDLRCDGWISQLILSVGFDVELSRNARSRKLMSTSKIDDLAFDAASQSAVVVDSSDQQVVCLQVAVEVARIVELL